VKIPGGQFGSRVGVVFMHRDYAGVGLDEDEDRERVGWYSTGSAAYAYGILHPSTQKLVDARARTPSNIRAVNDHWPRRVSLKFIYRAKVKEAGETYLVYKHRHIVRYVLESAQPPRILYGSGLAGMQDPVMTSQEAEVLVGRLGWVKVPRPTSDYALVDNPDVTKATMMVFPVSLPDHVAALADIEVKVAQAEKEFESTRATPQFREWFAGASEEVRNADDTPKVFFRGQTSNAGALKSRLVMDSFTDSSEIASIYSSKGGVYGEGASVVPVYIDVKNPLVIKYGSITLYDLLNLLGYWDGTGIGHDEVTKLLNYIIKRKRVADMGGFLGIAPKVPKGYHTFVGMPSFNFQIKQEEDTDAYADNPIEIEDGGLFSQHTKLDTFRDLWDELSPWKGDYVTDDDSVDFLRRLSLLLNVDTYALVETPAVKRALQKLGYDGVKHMDLFGAEGAAKKALGKDLADVEGIQEGEEDYDWDEMNYAYGHWTLRPLDRSQVWPLLSDEPMKVAARAAVRAITSALRLLS